MMVGIDSSRKFKIDTMIARLVVAPTTALAAFGGGDLATSLLGPALSPASHRGAAVRTCWRSSSRRASISTCRTRYSATSPAGPFAPRGDNPVKDQEAHNPSIARDEKNKRWCLFYIGRSPIDGPPATPAYPSGIADIAVTCAPSLDGPWQGKDAHNGPFPLVPHQLYPPRWDNWIQNP